jgi:hypothetical protein
VIPRAKKMYFAGWAASEDELIQEYKEIQRVSRAKKRKSK